MTWSHSREVKAELCRLEVTSAGQAAAELRGMWDVAGHGDRLGALPVGVTRRAYHLAKRLGAGPEITSRQSRGRTLVRLRLTEPEALPAHVDNPKAYLRGAFLARGYVALPERSYHVEIVAPHEDAAARLLAALQRLRLDAGVAQRRQGHAVYLKHQEHVAEFLAQIGAHGARLELASLQVVRSMRNTVNRQVNGETANLRRTVENGYRQAEQLRAWRNGGGFEGVGPDLRVLADLRIQHPDWSLRELGARMKPPLSKSGTAHRLRRLMAHIRPDPRD